MPSSPKRRIPWMTMLKVAIAMLIAVFIGKAVVDSRESFENSGFSLSNVDFRWMGVACISYILGLLPMTLNWHRLLRAMGETVPRGATVRAHYMSQLGKYVPGKAIVVAIRMSLLNPFGVKASTLFVSIVAETLAMMSVGSVLAAGIIAVLHWNRIEIALVACGLAAVATLPILPPVLRFALKLLQSRKAMRSPQPAQEKIGTPDLADTLTWKTIIPGWLGIFPGWLLLGVSMWATMKAMNIEETAGMTLADLPWITATYAISVVAGFLSMLPGGVGVREFVMKQMIETNYGPVVALLAPVFHRMMSLTSELTLAALLYGLFLRKTALSSGGFQPPQST